MLFFILFNSEYYGCLGNPNKIHPGNPNKNFFFVFLKNPGNLKEKSRKSQLKTPNKNLKSKQKSWISKQKSRKPKQQIPKSKQKKRMRNFCFLDFRVFCLDFRDLP
jgi:hypothetical protein